jgi:hypothetical protein
MMSNEYSIDDLLGFLDHAADRGLLPPATAQALAVASRNVMGVLSEDEKRDVRSLDQDAVVKRFQNKRAKDFSTDTLAEYGRRFRRATDLFTSWRNDPAKFHAPTRATSAGRKKRGDVDREGDSDAPGTRSTPFPPSLPGAYQTAVPLGPNRIVTLSNVPSDLTAEEAERLASFVRMLATAPK